MRGDRRHRHASSLPGFIDTHRHTWQAPWRNIASDWSLFHYLLGHAHRASASTTARRTPTPATCSARSRRSTRASRRCSTGRTTSPPPSTPTPRSKGLRDSGSRAVFAHGGGADAVGHRPRQHRPPSRGRPPRARPVLLLQRRAGDDGAGPPRPAVHDRRGGAARLGARPRARPARSPCTSATASWARRARSSG